MQVGTLEVKVNLNDLLAVIPATTGVGHEYGLEETEQGNRDEVRNEQRNGVIATHATRRSQASKTKGEEEDGQEDVEHTLLGILGTNLNDLDRRLGVGLLGCVRIELDVVLDKGNGTVGTDGNGLGRSTGEPVDNATTQQEADDGVGIQQVQQAGGIHAEGLLDHEDDREDHRGSTNDSGTDEHGLGSGLEGVACTVVLLEVVL